MSNFKRHNRTSDFTIMYNGISKDKNLSYKAKGLLYTLHSVSEDWEFSEVGLSKLSTDGIDSVKSGLKELEKAGYLIRERVRENGKLKGTVYHFYDEPQTPKKDDNINVSTKSGFSNVGNSNVGKTHTIKNLPNKELKNKTLNDDTRLIDRNGNEEKTKRNLEYVTRNGEKYEKEEFMKLENHYGKRLVTNILKRTKYKEAIKNDPIAYLSKCLAREYEKQKLKEIKSQSESYKQLYETENKEVHLTDYYDYTNTSNIIDVETGMVITDEYYNEFLSKFGQSMIDFKFENNLWRYSS